MREKVTPDIHILAGRNPVRIILDDAAHAVTHSFAHALQLNFVEALIPLVAEHLDAMERERPRHAREGRQAVLCEKNLPRSNYMPHQGKREIARRSARGVNGE